MCKKEWIEKNPLRAILIANAIGIVIGISYFIAYAQYIDLLKK